MNSKYLTMPLVLDSSSIFLCLKNELKIFPSKKICEKGGLAFRHGCHIGRASVKRRDEQTSSPDGPDGQSYVVSISSLKIGQNRQ